MSSFGSVWGGARGYRLCDVMRGPLPNAGGNPSLAEFGKMSWLEKTTVSTDASDALIFSSVDPALRSRVFGARKNVTNGVHDPADDELRDEIARMGATGELDASVAAALLRLVSVPPMATGFEARDIPFSEASEGGSESPRSYYDPAFPSPGKAAGLWDELRRTIAKSKPPRRQQGKWTGNRWTWGAR